MNKQSLTYQALVNGASTMVLQGLGVVYRILLAWLLGAVGMGEFSLDMQRYTILASVCIYGLSTATTALIAKYGDVQRIVRMSVLAFLMLYAASAAVTLTVYGTGTIILLCCILLTGFENILKGAFTALGQVRINAASEIGEFLLRMGAVCLLIVKDAPHAVFLGMTLAEVYAVAFLWSRYRRLPTRRTNARIRFFPTALPSVGTSIISNVFSSLTTLSFPLRHDIAQLGVINMATPILMFPVSLVGALSSALMPSIAAAKHRRRIRMGAFVTCGVCAVVLAITPFLPHICQALYQTSVPWNMAVLLGLQACVAALKILGVCLLNGLSQQKFLFLTSFFCEVLQFLLAWYLPGVTGYLCGVLLGDVVRLLLFVFKILSLLRR